MKYCHCHHTHQPHHDGGIVARLTGALTPMADMARAEACEMMGEHKRALAVAERTCK